MPAWPRPVDDARRDRARLGWCSACATIARLSGSCRRRRGGAVDGHFAASLPPPQRSRGAFAGGVSARPPVAGAWRSSARSAPRGGASTRSGDAPRGAEASPDVARSRRTRRHPPARSVRAGRTRARVAARERGAGRRRAREGVLARRVRWSSRASAADRARVACRTRRPRERAVQRAATAAAAATTAGVGRMAAAAPLSAPACCRTTPRATRRRSIRSSRAPRVWRPPAANRRRSTRSPRRSGEEAASPPSGAAARAYAAPPRRIRGVGGSRLAEARSVGGVAVGDRGRRSPRDAARQAPRPRPACVRGRTSVVRGGTRLGRRRSERRWSSLALLGERRPWHRHMEATRTGCDKARAEDSPPRATRRSRSSGHHCRSVTSAPDSARAASAPARRRSLEGGAHGGRRVAVSTCARRRRRWSLRRASRGLDEVLAALRGARGMKLFARNCRGRGAGDREGGGLRSSTEGETGGHRSTGARRRAPAEEVCVCVCPPPRSWTPSCRRQRLEGGEDVGGRQQRPYGDSRVRGHVWLTCVVSCANVATRWALAESALPTGIARAAAWRGCRQAIARQPALVRYQESARRRGGDLRGAAALRVAFEASAADGWKPPRRPPASTDKALAIATRRRGASCSRRRRADRQRRRAARPTPRAAARAAILRAHRRARRRRDRAVREGRFSDPPRQGGGGVAASTPTSARRRGEAGASAFRARAAKIAAAAPPGRRGARSGEGGVGLVATKAPPRSRARGRSHVEQSLKPRRRRASAVRAATARGCPYRRWRAKRGATLLESAARGRRARADGVRRSCGCRPRVRGARPQRGRAPLAETCASVHVQRAAHDEREGADAERRARAAAHGAEILDLPGRRWRRRQGAPMSAAARRGPRARRTAAVAAQGPPRRPRKGRSTTSSRRRSRDRGEMRVRRDRSSRRASTLEEAAGRAEEPRAAPPRRRWTPRRNASPAAEALASRS